MTDDEVKENDEKAEEGDILPPPTALAAEEHDEAPDPFLDGFGDESLDPEEADALAMGYRIRSSNAEEDDDDLFSGDDE